jgi:hypothetical protein
VVIPSPALDPSLTRAPLSSTVLAATLPSARVSLTYHWGGGRTPGRAAPTPARTTAALCGLSPVKESAQASTPHEAEEEEEDEAEEEEEEAGGCHTRLFCSPAVASPPEGRTTSGRRSSPLAPASDPQGRERAVEATEQAAADEADEEEEPEHMDPALAFGGGGGMQNSPLPTGELEAEEETEQAAAADEEEEPEHMDPALAFGGGGGMQNSPLPTGELEAEEETAATSSPAAAKPTAAQAPNVPVRGYSLRSRKVVREPTPEPTPKRSRAKAVAAAAEEEAVPSEAAEAEPATTGRTTRARASKAAEEAEPTPLPTPQPAPVASQAVSPTVGMDIAAAPPSSR